MKTPEDKAEMLRQQVISKIYWGAREQEVTDWLSEEHGITGAGADQLLADAFRARTSAIRGRALMRLVLSILGILLVGAFIYVRFLSGAIFYGSGAIISAALALAIGGVSIVTFVRSVAHLLTGETHGSVD